MNMRLLALILSATAAIGPLTEEERIIIDTAYDGRDHREAAYIALAEHAAAWTDGVGDEQVRLAPDFDAILADPGEYRGDLCLIAGRIEQQSPLDGLDALMQARLIVIRLDRHGLLREDQAGIDSGIHQVDRAAGELDPIVEG